MSSDVRIDVLTDAIKQLPKGEIKDALADDLKFAQDINGTTDPALRGIKRLVISGIRRELLTHERIAEAVTLAVEAQAAKCRAFLAVIRQGSTATYGQQTKDIQEAGF